MNEEIIDKLLKTAKQIGYEEIPPYQHCECYTTGAFDLIIIQDAPGDNFYLLQIICSRYKKIKDDSKYLDGYIYLLGVLAYASKTTELPKGMMQIINDNLDKTLELQSWYRIK